MTSLLDWLCAVAPHPARRALFRRFRRVDFEYLTALSEAPEDEPYGLRPFHEHRAIFVHVPKAAGVSLCRNLFGGLVGGHTTLAQYRIVFDPAEYDSYFKFTFVRNPWDRIHSAYHFLIAGGMEEKDARWAREHLADYSGFDDFVKRWVNDLNVLSKVHFVPQHRFIVLPGSRRPGVDFIGRFENLDEDYEVVRRRVHGAGGAQRTHENRTPRGAKPDYRREYSDEARRIVARVYRRDIELLGYEFE